MTVYSPHQSQLHLECQLKRLLVKERWVPRYIEQRDISAILGSAIAKGLEVFNKGEGAKAAGAAAFTEALRMMTAALEVGRVLGDHFKSQWERVPVRAEAALNSYGLLTDPLGGMTIVDVEVPYGPEFGNARPDLIVADGLAPRVPLDYKVSLTLGKTKSEREKSRERRIGQWAHAFQLMEYSWIERVLHFYIGMIVLEPEFSFEVIPFQIHPETMQAWANSAEQTWTEMQWIDEGDCTPTMAANHADQFGECPYKRACFDHHLDPVLMAQDYVKVER